MIFITLSSLQNLNSNSKGGYRLPFIHNIQKKKGGANEIENNQKGDAENHRVGET